MAVAGSCQTLSERGKFNAPEKISVSHPSEDISGMYSFTSTGEFLQINIEDDRVTGYISRRGDLESDRETFLDQFFDKAAIDGHDVAFTTRMLHGEWFEFKGRFDHGHAKTKDEDGYYILRGTLTEFSGDPKNPAARQQKVEFKWMAQPQDIEEKQHKSKKK